ncbi:MAG TPA: DUF4097 family beta strand repeat-containing protein [Phycisphaerae bacterium]|nr:DUF4097 family beta strand repeat-containing protein [Phycisphaerae bacterium]
MTARRICLPALLGLGFVLVTGCSIGPVIWTDKVTEELRIDAQGLNRLELETHNGEIDWKGRSSGEPVAVIKVTKKAGGLTVQDARDALAAVEVNVKQTADGVKEVAWTWRTGPKPSWSADVQYEVEAPAGLALDAQTHNGSIRIDGADANVEAVSHNGSVKVRSSGGRLRVETHNGEINAAYEGGDIFLVTHNGEVTADLSRCKSVAGEISSYNGGITLAAGKELSADLSCSTYNGHIDCDAPYRVEHASRSELAGRLGDGGRKLTVVTHNGNIRVK